ncbi:TPA: hypothetical protein ACTXXA_001739 [Legionella anisa]
MEDLGKDTFQKIMASTESIPEPSSGTDNATLEKMEELGKDTLEKNKIYADTSQTFFKQNKPESTIVEEKEANLNPKGNVT